MAVDISDRKQAGEPKQEHPGQAALQADVTPVSASRDYHKKLFNDVPKP